MTVHSFEEAWHQREIARRDAFIAHIRSLAPDHVVLYMCEAMVAGVPKAEIESNARAMMGYSA